MDALDLLEELLSILEEPCFMNTPVFDLMTEEQRQRVRTISAQCADLRDGEEV